MTRDDLRAAIAKTFYTARAERDTEALTNLLWLVVGSALELQGALDADQLDRQRIAAARFDLSNALRILESKAR